LVLNKARFYAEAAEASGSIEFSIHDSQKGKRIGKIEADVRLPDSMWIDIRIYNTESNMAFFRKFRRSTGQELLIRALKWGQKKELSRIYLGDASAQAKKTVQRLVELGVLRKDGKILRLPRQLNLKKNRLLEKPLLPRKPLIRRLRRKPKRA